MPQGRKLPTEEVSRRRIRWIPVASLVGFLALVSAWFTFPPELVIEGVVNKSEEFSSESMIRVKNNGVLPAISTRALVENFSARIGTLTIKDMNMFSGPIVIGRLARDESDEISILPTFGVPPGTHLSSCSYILILKYKIKLFFITKNARKKWKVELRNFGSYYSWRTSIL